MMCMRCWMFTCACILTCNEDANAVASVTELYSGSIRQACLGDDVTENISPEMLGPSATTSSVLLLALKAKFQT